jgi:UDP:flavonoid glycosyltransferase YjiC (YdhE family)
MEPAAMRIAIIASGSRGDIEPYIALGQGLKKAGHVVRLVTHENYRDLVASRGVEFWPVAGSVQDVAQSDAMRALLGRGNFLAIMAQMAKEAERGALRLAEGALAAARGMDCLLGGFAGLFVGVALAEKLDLPLIQAHYVPFTPTRAYPSAPFAGLPIRLGGAFNRLSYQLTRQMMWQAFRPADRLTRRQVLGLPAAPFWGPFDAECLRRTPVLYGFSPAVIPPAPDWDSRTHVTGYWFPEEAASWTPPAALVEFLQAGPAPVYVGFGSMSTRKPEETAELIVQALARSGQRGVLLTGWGGLSAAHLPDSVYCVDSIPFDWLFPRVAAVVHHGGAGTTAAGLRAGVPSLVVPFFGDQPFWGRRVLELGVGPAPIPHRKLTVARLAQSIRQMVTDQAMRERAARLGAIIRAEDGVARAVGIVQQMDLK